MARACMVLALLISGLSFASGSIEKTEYAKAAQYLNDRGELYFMIHPNSAADVHGLANEVSLDRIDEVGNIIAYANKQEFERFLKRNLRYTVLVPPCFQTKVTMSDYKAYLQNERGALAKSVTAWNAYPTYDAYIQMMAKFQTDYPTLARQYELATSLQSRKVLAMKVTANVTASNGKPRLYYISTVHGDEVLNYVNTLHVMDTLLSKYGTDTRLTRILDNVEIWFVPLYNPDGTYKGGNTTVQSAQRYNANGVDLNRNYPCPCGQTGTHAQYGLYTKREPENLGIMNLYQRYYWHLATDLHSGTETALWPYGALSRRPCDEEWYKWVAKRYVDTVHKACNNNGYFTSCGGDGMGNIYSELYVCHGTSVDYTIFYMRARVIPFETSLTKLLPESQIITHWNYNKESIIQFLEVLLTGIQGKVRDSRTKTPIIAAKVQEATHDFDSAYVYTDSAGFYLRFILKGTWNLTFSKAGYVSKTVPITVDDYAKKYPLDVELDPIGTAVSNSLVSLLRGGRIVSGAAGVSIDLGNAAAGVRMAIYRADGALVREMLTTSGSRLVWDGTDGQGRSVRNGCYVVKAQSASEEASKSFILSR